MFTLSLVKCSFETLSLMPDRCVDHVITDPPYDKHTQDNQASGTAKRGTRSIPNKALPFGALEGYAFAADLTRVSRRWALSFCSIEGLGEMLRVVGRNEYVRGGFWYKPNSQGSLRGDRPAAAYETIAIMHNAQETKRWNGRGSYGVWVCNSTRGKKDRHPNEKPLDLCLKLVALFTERGETVFDPWCGSSAIGEACLLLGRKYYGIDYSQEWIDKSHTRLSRVPFDSYSDAQALSLCTAKKSEILEGV